MAAALASCTVTDGDTIKCRGERIRLIGIDAPDDPANSRCRPYPKPGAVCDRRRAAASKTALESAMSGTVHIDRVSRDRYGRTIANVFAGQQSLSCHQLSSGHAVYVPKWDDGGRVARSCPKAAFR